MRFNLKKFQLLLYGTGKRPGVVCKRALSDLDNAEFSHSDSDREHRHYSDLDREHRPQSDLNREHRPHLDLDREHCSDKLGSNVNIAKSSDIKIQPAITFIIINILALVTAVGGHFE